MKYFDLIITDQLIWLIKLCHSIIPNYTIAIILFTLIVRIVLFPITLWAQWQAVKLAIIKPKLNDIKSYFSHDWRLALREQKKLYKKEKYSTFVSMLPLLLQIPIIIGVIRGVDASGILSDTPSDIFLPTLAALSAFALCYVQNLCNVLAKEMRFMAKWGLAIFLTAFSFYFSIICGIGFGVYWTAGNAFAIATQFICNAIIKPKNYVTYEILPPPKKDKQLIKRQKEKQKVDVKNFNKTKKNLVFYSESSGFYKYFKGMVEYVLENSKIHVHYLTSDINDQVFNVEHPRFHAYYCGPRKLITVFMKLDCRVAVMSLCDLHKYQYKRSIVNKNIEYIYVDHGFTGLTVMTRKKAYDYYDTIFCYGKNYNEAIRAMEASHGSKEKKLINTGFELYNELDKKFKPKTNAQETIIIAPSWQKDNIFEICIDDIMKALDGTDYRVILRPHPEFTKRFPQKIELLKNKYKSELQLDFSMDILDADILISDWSSIGWEFAYATNKPALFINTPMKVMNPDWQKYGVTPLELILREKTGLTIDLDEISDLKSKLEVLKKIKNPRSIIDEIMYDNSAASKTSGDYIIKSVKELAQKNK